MKAPHLMPEWERRETVQRWHDEAVWMRQEALYFRDHVDHTPEARAKSQNAADAWGKRAAELKASNPYL